MAKRTRVKPADFTVAQLKAMLAAKTRIDELEAQRGELRKSLDEVEKELASLLAGVTSGKGRKKAAAKKTVSKRGAKKAAAKRGTKKAAHKVAARSAKAAKKKAAPTKGRVTVESVVVDLLKKNGAPMSFKDILATIQKKKLVKTKSANFANVLRRTLSTSEVVKRAGRGVYRV